MARPMSIRPRRKRRIENRKNAYGMVYAVPGIPSTFIPKDR
jgi:hypothetical protein